MPPVVGEGRRGRQDEGVDDDSPAEGEPKLDSLAAEATERQGHPAAYASNWRQVLLVDASMGAVVLVGGIVAMFVWNLWIGAGVGALGAAYVVAVSLRYQRWKATRQEAGLPT
jgi:hypothetical protein